MKRKITQTEYDALTDALKALYKQDGDVWLLELEDDESFNQLKEEKRREKEAREAAEARAAKLQKEKDDAAEAERLAKEEAARKDGDVEALENSWKEKHDRDVKAARAEGDAAKAALTNMLVRNVARDMAEAICTVPDLIVDQISSRLTVEITDGEAITRVLSADKKPSALSLDDLRKEFVDNPKFASIMKSSDAGGGGANHTRDGNGVPPKKLSEMTATEEAAFANKHPEQYKRMLEGRG